MGEESDVYRELEALFVLLAERYPAGCKDEIILPEKSKTRLTLKQSVSNLYKFIYERGGNMALIQCPECKKEVSNVASSCPKCGYALKPHIVQIKTEKKTGCFTKILIFIVGFTVIWAISKGCDSKKPETKIYEPKNEESVIIPSGCKKHVEIKDSAFWAKELMKSESWIQANHKINLWEYGVDTDRGKMKGVIMPGSRAVLIEEKGDYYKIKSPYDNSIGWVNKIQVKKTLYQDTSTFKQCTP